MITTVVQRAVVRRAKEEDLPAMARINAVVFMGNRDKPNTALTEMSCWFRAFPLYQYFVVEFDGNVAGYISWLIWGGFLRTEPVIELEQIGVDSACQTKGLGHKLMDESLKEMIKWVREHNDRIESHLNVVVWVYAHNLNALSVYYKRFTHTSGMRVQYGERAEIMLRVRIPIIRPIRKVSKAAESSGTNDSLFDEEFPPLEVPPSI